MAALTANLRLIVGLGNPGADYVDTRHNAGFWLIDEIAADQGLSFRFEKRFNADECKFRAHGRDVFLLKPQTFMNRSGQSVAALARYYKILPEEILVIHDELDLPPGVNRIKQSGGHGGHNGLRDIINHLGSREFFRVGCGEPAGAYLHCGDDDSPESAPPLAPSSFRAPNIVINYFTQVPSSTCLHAPIPGQTLLASPETRPYAF